MKILVLGAGAIGSVFGGFLAKAGHEVFMVGRRQHMEAIAREGLLIDGIWGTHAITANIHTATELALHGAALKTGFDICLLTVKSYDTAAAAELLAGTLHAIPPVLSLQNGLGNIETIERLLGRKKTIGGRVIFGVEYRRPGRVTVTVAADKTYIGGLPEGIARAYVQELADSFTGAGIPTAATDDIQQYIWGKALYNCTLNPLATILDVHYGLLLSNDATKMIMRQLLEEIFTVTASLPLTLPWPTAAAYADVLFNELIPKTFEHHPSMLQDINRGKKTEIDSLNAALITMAEKSGIAMPCNRVLTQLIKAKELLCSTTTPHEN